MSVINLRCPHCSFSRDLPAAKVPDKPVQVNCPRCGKSFPFCKQQLQADRPAEPPVGRSGLSNTAVAASRPALSGVSQKQGGDKQNPAAPVRDEAPEKPPAAAKAKPAQSALVALLVIVIASALWWLNFPSAGRPVEGSYADPKGHFAVKAPPEWLLVSPDNFSSIMEQYRDRIPREISSLFGKGKPAFSVSYFRIPAAESEFSPNFNVIVLDTKGRNLPRLTETEKNSAAQKASQHLSSLLTGYKMKESAIVQVDGLDSLQIIGEAELSVVTRKSEPIYASGFGRRVITGRTEEEKQNYLIRCVQTMIPGKKRAYVISFMYDDLKTPEMGSIQRQVLDTFRVLERPPRFGGIVMGALNGGLAGAIAYPIAILAVRLLQRKGDD